MSSNWEIQTLGGLRFALNVKSTLQFPLINGTYRSHVFPNVCFENIKKGINEKSAKANHIIFDIGGSLDRENFIIKNLFQDWFKQFSIYNFKITSGIIERFPSLQKLSRKMKVHVRKHEAIFPQDFSSKKSKM